MIRLKPKSQSVMEGHNCRIKTFGFILLLIVTVRRNFPCDSVVKDLPAMARDAGLIPGSGTSPGGENGNPLQYSCLENPMDRGSWPASVHGVTKESYVTANEQQQQ